MPYVIHRNGQAEQAEFIRVHDEVRVLNRQAAAMERVERQRALHPVRSLDVVVGKNDPFAWLGGFCLLAIGCGVAGLTLAAAVSIALMIVVPGFLVFGRDH